MLRYLQNIQVPHYNNLKHMLNPLVPYQKETGVAQHMLKAAYN